MGKGDTGFVKNYYAKAHKAFGGIAGFNEFADQVMRTKKFKSGTAEDQESYFIVALKSELKDRGCL